MKDALLELLACPDCGGELRLTGATTAEGEIDSGELDCGACARRFPIRRGIPRFSGDSDDREARERIANFSYQWTHFREELEAYRESFLDWMTPIGEADFDGKIVLDAGCGMGRFTAQASELGAAAAVGVDLSQSVEVAQVIARKRPNMHVVQADLLRLPFRDPFDLAYSVGVLHHLPDGEAGFRAVVGHVRPGGTVHAWVYGHEGNEWLLRFVDPVRRHLTSRLPHPLTRLLTLGIALPLHGALRLLYRDAAETTALPYAAYLRWLARFPLRHTHQVVFDHLAVPIAHYYRREEFAAWFERAGLSGALLTARNQNSWRGTARVATAKS